MKTNKYMLIGIVALALATFLWGAHWYKRTQEKKAETAPTASLEKLVRGHSPRLGPENALVTIVEFLDPECEACAYVYPMVKQVLREYEGKVRLVIRYMPLHKNSAFAAGLLEGARKHGKYWEALELFFNKQPEWASHQAPKPELLWGYIKELGLDGEAVKVSSDDMAVKGQIQRDEQDGRDLGVTGTPTFFVNGKLLTRLGYEELRNAVASALNSSIN